MLANAPPPEGILVDGGSPERPSGGNGSAPGSCAKAESTHAGTSSSAALSHGPCEELRQACGAYTSSHGVPNAPITEGAECAWAAKISMWSTGYPWPAPPRVLGRSSKRLGIINVIRHHDRQLDASAPASNNHLTGGNRRSWTVSASLFQKPTAHDIDGQRRGRYIHRRGTRPEFFAWNAPSSAADINSALNRLNQLTRQYNLKYIHREGGE